MTTPTTLHVPKSPCHLLRVNHQHHLCTPPPRSVLLLWHTPNTHIRIGCFELPLALAAQVLLPRVQDQAGGILSVLDKGEARVELGRMSGVEAEMQEIPMLGQEER